MVNREVNQLLDDYIGQLRRRQAVPLHRRIARHFAQRTRPEPAQEEDVVSRPAEESEDYEFLYDREEQEKKSIMNRMRKLLSGKKQQREEQSQEHELMSMDLNTEEETETNEMKVEPFYEEPETEPEPKPHRAAAPVKESAPEQRDTVVREHGPGFFSRLFSARPRPEIYEEPAKTPEEMAAAAKSAFELELEEVLNIVNELFKKLPPSVKYEFKKSPDYEVYANFLKKYRVRKL